MLNFFQETGEPVGTVVNVFDVGGSDLLQVKLDSSLEVIDKDGNLKSEAPLVWIPFVESIVPHVDLSKREMLITPPKGLLELNVRSDERSKKERRQLVSQTFFFCYFSIFLLLFICVFYNFEIANSMILGFLILSVIIFPYLTNLKVK